MQLMKHIKTNASLVEEMGIESFIVLMKNLGTLSTMIKLIPSLLNKSTPSLQSISNHMLLFQKNCTYCHFLSIKNAFESISTMNTITPLLRVQSILSFQSIYIKFKHLMQKNWKKSFLSLLKSFEPAMMMNILTPSLCDQ